MSETTQTIPVVDLTAWREGDDASRAAFVGALGEGLEALGFVALEGHGVPDALIRRCYALYREFFAQDEDVKKAYEHPERGRERGYTSFGVEHAKDSELPDLKEFWHFGRELPAGHPLFARLPENVWPERFDALREASQALFEALDACALDLLSALSLYLDQDPDRLPSMVRDGNSVVRVIHYPPPINAAYAEAGAVRAAAHEDINLITLLPAATSSGLEILTRDGEWLPVYAIPGQLIVDTGDMFKRITNDRIPATTHRVINPTDQTDSRYSMPFFVHPHHNAMLEVLDSCVAEGEAPKYDPVDADAYLQERLRAIGVAS